MLHMNEHHDSWIGRTLNDASGHRIGRVEDIYTDDDTGQPEWLAVATTGLLGSNLTFVPIVEATLTGNDLRVPFKKDQVKKAPGAGADGRLSAEEEARIYAHYGYDYDEERVRLQRSTDDPRAEPAAPVGTQDERGRWAEEEAAFPQPERSHRRERVGSHTLRR